jgi:hypothetical protein
MDADAFDLSAAWFVLASDEGPLDGDPLSTELSADRVPEAIDARSPEPVDALPRVRYGLRAHSPTPSDGSRCRLRHVAGSKCQRVPARAHAPARARR